MLEFRDAVRETVSLLIAVYGPTGAGKTYGALLLAAGLAGPDGTVGMIDAENKRGSLYADDPGIRAAMPGGRYKILDISAPYTPAKYTEAVKAAEKAGITVCVIDSTSHEWAGEGGCCDIAENNKLGGMPNWAKAKIEHKKFVSYCLSSQMHIIFCLRAHEKTKPVKAGDLISPDGPERYEKTSVIALGMLPDTEKNLVFEVLLSLRVDDGTHFANPVKVPKMLAHLFPGKKLLTKADGEAIRQWNLTGSTADASEQLCKRATAAATQGTAAYRDFFSSLTADQRKSLAPFHDANKAEAAKADNQGGPPKDLADLPDFPDQPTAEWYQVKGIIYRYDEAAGSHRPWMPERQAK